MECIVICLTPTDLAYAVAAAFGTPLQHAELIRFSDGEVNVAFSDWSIAFQKTVIIVQSTTNPVNELFFGIAFLAQELKNAGASNVIAVIPYLGYTRQERSAMQGKNGPIHVIAQLLESSGIDVLVAVELHNASIATLFSIPVYNLSLQSIITNHIKNNHPSKIHHCLVAPDKGIAPYVQAVAEALEVDTVIYTKERFAPDKTRIVDVHGQCKGAIGIVVDDILATGGTAKNVAEHLMQRGYSSLYGYFIHPVFAGNAVDLLHEGYFTRLYVSNTLPLPVSIRNHANVEQFDSSAVIITALKEIINESYA